MSEGCGCERNKQEEVKKEVTEQEKTSACETPKQDGESSSCCGH